MNNTKRIGVLACALGLSLLASSTQGADPKDKPEGEVDFAGKVLMIYTKDPAKGAILEGVKIRQLGARSFLVGKTIETGKKSPWEKVVMWVAVDDIVEIFQFNSADDAKKAKEESEPKQP